MFTRIANHHDHSVGAVLDQLRDDALEDVDVALHKIEATLALALARSRSDDADAAAFGHRII